VIAGGIVPDRLREALDGGGDDGLAARFIWIWPDAAPYQPLPRATDAQAEERRQSLTTAAKRTHDRGSIDIEAMTSPILVAGTSWVSRGTLQPAHALLAAIAGSVSRSRTSFSASPIFALISSCGNIWRAHRVWNERVSRKAA
jgi:hypothetical protein